VKFETNGTERNEVEQNGIEMKTKMKSIKAWNIGIGISLMKSIKAWNNGIGMELDQTNKQLFLVKDSSTNKPHRKKLWLLVHFL
jgi:hypothetical protein